MAETALLQQLAAFIGALWWTKQWLAARIAIKWRYAVAGLVSTLLWVIVGYTATNAPTPDGAGSTILFNSLPVAYFGAFMAVVSVVGTILGLLLWTEEELKETGQGVPDSLRSDISRKD